MTIAPLSIATCLILKRTVRNNINAFSVIMQIHYSHSNVKKPSHSSIAPPEDVCLHVARYVQRMRRVVLYSAHMFNQDRGFVDSNLTLCDLQISGRKGGFVHWNVRQVFVWMRREASAGDLHFSISGENSGT